MTNTSNPRKIREAEQREKRLLAQQRNDLLSIMDTPAGRRVLRRVIYTFAGRDRSSYLDATRGSDPVFFEGQRNVGLRLLAEMQTVSVNLYLLMEAEHFEALAQELKEETTEEESGNE